MVRVFAVFLALAALVTAPTARASAGELQLVGSQQLSPRLTELTLRTPALGRDVRVRVLLPDGYDADAARRYPVIYLLHGTDNEPRTLTDNMDVEASTAPLPVILVMPEGGRGSYYADWYNGGAGGPPQWERFHIGQLLPFIDARYRTVAAREGRAIVGLSMGGFGSMGYAARHPDLFAAAASLSGAVNSNDPAGGAAVTASPFLFDGGAPDAAFGPRATEEVRWRGHNPWDLADNLRGLDLQVLTHDGRPGGPHGEGPDPVEVLVHRMSRELHERLTELGIPHVWTDYGPGTHGWAYFQDKLHVAIARIMRVFADPPAPPPSFRHRAIAPAFSVWGWRFEADPRRATEFLEASAAGGELTLTGSGTVTVTTPPAYRGLRAVDAAGAADGHPLGPDRAGRVTFTVDLGPPHTAQQLTAGARAAGEGTASYLTTRTVRLVPRAELRLGRAVRGRARGSLRVTVHALAGPIHGVRVVLRDAAGRSVGASRRRVDAGGTARAVLVRFGRSLRGRRYRVVATGLDGAGRRVHATRTFVRRR